MANQAQFVKIVHLNQRNWVVQVDNFNKLSLIGHFSVLVNF